MHVGREDAHAVRDDPVAEKDVELWLAEVAAQQRAHDLRREVGVARPLAPRPPPVVDEAHGLGVGADAGGEREAPAVDDAEVDAALTSRDERLRHDLGGGSEIARHAQRARQHARPAGRQDADGKRVARAVEHLVGGAVASHRNDAVEPTGDGLARELDRVPAAPGLDQLDVALRLQDAQDRPHRALADGSGDGVDDQSQPGLRHRVQRPSKRGSRFSRNAATPSA